MRFEERFAITQHAVTVEKAAWICRNSGCLFEKYVRNEDQFEP
jgi:hypothetical protein